MEKPLFSPHKPSFRYPVELLVYLDVQYRSPLYFTLKPGQNIIGSDEKECSIVLPQRDIGKKHLYIDINFDSITCGSIQALSSVDGTQRQMKDGNFATLLPGKQTIIGNLSKDFCFYIAKKYKCVIRKAAAEQEPRKSKDKIDFLKALGIVKKIQNISLQSTARHHIDMINEAGETQLEVPKESQVINDQPSPHSKTQLLSSLEQQQPLNQTSDLLLKYRYLFQTPESLKQREQILHQSPLNQSLAEIHKSNEKVNTINAISNEVKAENSTNEEDLEAQLAALAMIGQPAQKHSHNRLSESTMLGYTQNKSLTVAAAQATNAENNNPAIELSEKLLSQLSNSHCCQPINVSPPILIPSSTPIIPHTYNRFERSTSSSPKAFKQTTAIEEQLNSTRIVSSTTDDDESSDNWLSKPLSNCIAVTRRLEEQKTKNYTSSAAKPLPSPEDHSVLLVKRNHKTSTKDQDSTYNDSGSRSKKLKFEWFEDACCEEKAQQMKAECIQPSNLSLPTPVSHKDASVIVTTEQQSEPIQQTIQLTQSKPRKSRQTESNFDEKQTSKNSERTSRCTKATELIHQDSINIRSSSCKPTNSLQFSSSSHLLVMLSNCTLDGTEIITRLKKLGVRIVTSLKEPFNVLLMDSFIRRAKPLVALNLQVPILSSSWAQDCVSAGKIIRDFSSYSVQIPTEFQTEHSFSMDKVTERQLEIKEGRSPQIFEGLSFILPDSEVFSKLPQEDLESLITSGGGLVLKSSHSQEYSHSYTTTYAIFSNNTTTSDKRKSAKRLALIESNKKNKVKCIQLEALFITCLHQTPFQWREYAL